MTWYRRYDETLHDEKLRIIANDLNRPLMWVHGVWSGILDLASRSPIRGDLLITSTRPYTLSDITVLFSEKTRAISEVFHALLRANLLTYEQETWSVSQWQKRQFESDISTNRVQKHRGKKRFGNVSETSLACAQQIQSTDTEGNHHPIEGDGQEQEIQTERPLGDDDKKSSPRYLFGTLLTPMIPRDYDYQLLDELISDHGQEPVTKYLRECWDRKVHGRAVMPYVRKCLQNSAKEVTSEAINSDRDNWR